MNMVFLCPTALYLTACKEEKTFHSQPFWLQPRVLEDPTHDAHLYFYLYSLAIYPGFNNTWGRESVHLVQRNEMYPNFYKLYSWNVF